MPSRTPPPIDTATRARVAALATTPAASALLRAARGARVLLVGGALRDAALGRPVGDLDAVVERDGGDVAASLAAALGGRAIRLAPGRFAAWRIAGPESEVDLWDLEGGTVEADLARRDLTVNALALDLATGMLLDPHGGLADVVRRRLRAVRLATFAEDPLRVLRLARFAAALDGFTVDEATASAARGAVSGLDHVAGERVRDELGALSALDRPAVAQAALALVGVFPGLWRGFASPPTRIPEGDGVGELSRLEAARRRLADPDPHPAGPVVAEHALRLVLALPGGGRDAALARLERRAVVSGAEARAVRELFAAAAATPPRGVELARLLWRLGTLWQAGLTFDAALAPAAAEAVWNAGLDEARAQVRRRGAELLAPRPLVGGEEAARLLGIDPGPRLGAALRALVEAQVVLEVTSIEAARAFLQRLARAGGG